MYAEKLIAFKPYRSLIGVLAVPALLYACGILYKWILYNGLGIQIQGSDFQFFHAINTTIQLFPFALYFFIALAPVVVLYLTFFVFKVRPYFIYLAALAGVYLLFSVFAGYHQMATMRSRARQVTFQFEKNAIIPSNIQEINLQGKLKLLPVNSADYLVFFTDTNCSAGQSKFARIKECQVVSLEIN